MIVCSPFIFAPTSSATSQNLKFSRYLISALEWILDYTKCAGLLILPVEYVVISCDKIPAKIKIDERGVIGRSWPSFWREIFEQPLCC